MAFGFVKSLLGTSYTLARQCWLQVEPWAALAVRTEFQDCTLAIVGNAGYLAEVEQGSKIDGHDQVLRMNNFRTAGFERQVGARTDIFLSTFYRDVRLDNPAIKEAKFLIASVPNNLQRNRRRGVWHAHGAHLAAGLARLRRNQIYVPDWQLFLEQKETLGKYPTTGAMAILLATEFLAPVCRSIYLTGFSFFRGKSHYFSEQQTVPRNHDMDREEQMVRALLRPHVAAGKVELDASLAVQLNLSAI